MKELSRNQQLQTPSPGADGTPEGKASCRHIPKLHKQCIVGSLRLRKCVGVLKILRERSTPRFMTKGTWRQALSQGE